MCLQRVPLGCARRGQQRQHVQALLPMALFTPILGHGSDLQAADVHAACTVLPTKFNFWMHSHTKLQTTVLGRAQNRQYQVQCL